ncbi:MAG: exosortase/archaeosortase family protein, partial [Planctomycetota bacterium]|nr:exosortase/archaeosortase family protein [Planctomycetota bacterium]
MKRPMRSYWGLREWALLTLLMGVAIWIHRAALADIVTIAFGSEEQSHIMLVPFVAGWLFWLRRSRVRSMQVAPSLWGPLIIALGWMMSWGGMHTETQAAWHAGALVTLLGCLTCLTGLSPLRQFLPVFIVLMFIIPVPGTIRLAIALPLQSIATSVTQTMLEFMGVPATRMGHVLIIHGEQVAVGEACNGMRMVFALGLIVYAFAFSMPLRTGVRIALLVLSPVAALVSNVIRLIPTTIFFGYGTVEQAQIFHNIAGWVMLPVALLMLVGVMKMIRW